MNRRICQCGTIHNFDSVLWDISKVKGYRGKFIECACGRKLARMVPVTEKLKQMWDSIKFGKQQKPTTTSEKGEGDES